MSESVFDSGLCDYSYIESDEAKDYSVSQIGAWFKNIHFRVTLAALEKQGTRYELPLIWMSKDR